MNGREIVAALHAGRQVFSSGMISPSPLWPAAVKQTGIDFVFVDTEHIPLDRQTLAWICQTYPALGLPSVVRLPCNDPFEACKVLDAGAGGVDRPVPRNGGSGSRPRRRGEAAAAEGPSPGGGASRPQHAGAGAAEYLEQRNGDKILIANIESVPAIENLPEICSVPGLDAVLIGPHDLSCSLGIPEQYDHPRFDEAVRTIFRIAREHRVGARNLFLAVAVDGRGIGARPLWHQSHHSRLRPDDLQPGIQAEIAQLRAGLGT